MVHSRYFLPNSCSQAILRCRCDIVWLHGVEAVAFVFFQVNALVEASYILIPSNGAYVEKESDLLVIDLGNLSIKSEKDPDAPKKYRVSYQ